METTRSAFKIIVTVLLFMGVARTAMATAVVSVVLGSSGTFVVQGSDFDGVAGVKMAITYDPATLSNPRVTLGDLMPGAMLVPNTAVPGVITFAMIQPRAASGSGILVTITYDVVNSAPGVILSIQQLELIGVSGIKIDGQAIFSNTPVAPAGSSSTDQSTTLAAGGLAQSPGTPQPQAATGSLTGWLGGVTMPQDAGSQRDKTETPSPPSAPVQAEGKPADTQPVKVEADIAGKPAAPAENKGSQVTGVLEAFRTYKGEISPNALTELFTRAMAGTKQEPPVALSDGKTAVKVYIDAGGKETPHFALNGARLVSLKTAGDTSWVIEALPNQGVYDASVMIMEGDRISQVPMTVAPPIPAEFKFGVGGKLTEADFKRFLSERGTGKSPRFDLNGDGKRDYIDDYIFTANYLAKLGFKVKGTGK